MYQSTCRAYSSSLIPWTFSHTMSMTYPSTTDGRTGLRRKVTNGVVYIELSDSEARQGIVVQGVGHHIGCSMTMEWAVWLKEKGGRVLKSGPHKPSRWLWVFSPHGPRCPRVWSSTTTNKSTPARQTNSSITADRYISTTQIAENLTVSSMRMNNPDTDLKCRIFVTCSNVNSALYKLARPLPKGESIVAPC
jgi:hypothetical protein